MRKASPIVLIIAVMAWILLASLVLWPRPWPEAVCGAVLAACILWILMEYDRWLKRPKP
jgi:uncharacterized membrane protein